MDPHGLIVKSTRTRRGELARRDGRPRSFRAGALVVGAACFVCYAAGCERNPTAGLGLAQLPLRPPPVSHSTFFDTPFRDGPAVTRACLECHPRAARELMSTVHWTWQGDPVSVPGHRGLHRIGKKNAINNFCIGISSNWGACTSCHAGFGWNGPDFDFNNPSLVDCLVCHDQSGTYSKQAKGAGLPDPSVDLLAVARSVGRPRRANCGACHFMGGGGDAVKHGDMDRSLLFPSEGVDVHMGRLELQCVDCHRTQNHRLRGRAMSVSVESAHQVSCGDCHAAQPHHDSQLNRHTARVACQACHIPSMSVTEGTKLSWDWSEAGKDLPSTDPHAYLKIKGRFTWAKGALPEYRWYNGRSTRYLLGDKIDPGGVTAITSPLGDRHDPSAKLWPFKRHLGKQLYDQDHRHLLLPNTSGPKGYWTKFDWDLAAREGAKATGLPYSGRYGFAATEMFWPLSHMVQRKEAALTCRDCHGERGRLDWRALGYPRDPLAREAVEHPRITLKDRVGQSVFESAAPLSTAQTCGGCHELADASFVATHRLHAGLALEALPQPRSELLRWGPRLPPATGEETNCFLCHLEAADHAARGRALASDQPEWSIGATLPAALIEEAAAQRWRWRPAAFDAEGAVELKLGRTGEASCGACHGLVDNGSAPLNVVLDGTQWVTETTGQVFSWQAIRRSALNLMQKDQQGQPWDIHAQRLVSCGACHYSGRRPAQLGGAIAKARAAKPGERRRCQSCHSLEGLHPWLPAQQQHFAKVACEACHVPRLALPARSLVDATVVRPDGSPRLLYRGIASAAADPAAGEVVDPATLYLAGYEPALVRARGGDGITRLTPANLVASYRWIVGKRPVPPALVQRVFRDRDGYRAEIIAALDSNHDGRVTDRELRLDTAAKVALVAKGIAALGAAGAVIQGELRPYPIYHGVGLGAAASRACARCHPSSEAARRSFVVAPYLPGGLRPTLAAAASAETVALDGALERGSDGALAYRPARPLATAAQRGPLRPKPKE
ncbi:MAG: tetrathionate reductase family octaheme c-type cytochrome [Proteobacteria bacterium]|nr:tetrathionate reductase family octaheme c-type cytochrome [Pseudomonadota bacterium]